MNNKPNLWWSLDVEYPGNLTDADREHIADSIRQGITSGELVPLEEEEML